MSLSSLYMKTSTLGGEYALFFVNRMQMLYLVLLMPIYLIDPYMIWIILAVGVASHFNLVIFSKWFSSDHSRNGYQGFVQLFGKRPIRFFTVIGLLVIVLKVTVFVIGYVEIVQQFMFPSINTNWLIIVLFLCSCYLAAKGMENTLRFAVIVFLSLVWVIFLFFFFYFPPIASLRDLYPLFPSEWSLHSWKGVLFVWSSLSGPEYLIFLAPWFAPQQTFKKHLLYANALSVLEYIILFIASLFFFGAHYLEKTNFPIVNMLRYIQSPVFERIDLILLTFYIFHYAFVLAIFLLLFYGAIRIIGNKVHKQPTPIGFVICSLFILACMILVNEGIWQDEAKQNLWLNTQLWVGALTYLCIPTILFVAGKRKGCI
ncbi:GerAB/ArcD/ProY family transporter [Halalkalibacterium ligniniphilum]|uniref:GerAB/ArcD/ProY family transporter n=1 Tax=Halalkalibacterium ligniniphilum TaxID=1134413 RepID=UPI000344BDC9|nr:GerAB/ArcD/ProY family transporter [Halalkalibacterium ligniniphilum]